MKKVRIYPNENQKKKLNDIFGANRFIYNNIVKESSDFYLKNKFNKKEFKEKFRKFAIKKEMKDIYPEYILDKPEEVMDSAYRDLVKALEADLAKSKSQKNKTGKGYQCKMLNFKTKKQPSQSIEIRSRNFKLKNDNKLYFWPTFFNNEGFIIKDKLPNLEYSVRLQRLRNGKYYLCIPIFHKELKSTITKSSCALDPGVRSFLTGYDPDGLTFELGTNIQEIMKRCLVLDKLKSKLRKFKGKRNKRYKLKKLFNNIQQKIKNMIKDAHHKISKWLVLNYDNILLPVFETQKMSKKIDRKISNGSVRSMMTWSHYKFKQLLKFKMEREGKQLINCTEEFTSKTCTNCKKINYKLGSSKIFKCNSCNLKLDRDINASRNIYEKNLELLF